MPSLGLALGLPYGRKAAGVAANSAEAQAFFDRLTTPPTPGGARESAYASCIDLLVSAGVFAKLDCLYLFAAVDEATAFTNLIQTPFQAGRYQSTGAADFTVDVGFSGGLAGEHITTNFNPSTAAGKYAQNSACVGIWETDGTQRNSITACVETAISAIIAGLAIYPKWSDGNSYTDINSSADFTGANAGDSTGLFMAVRSGSNTANLFRRTSAVSETTIGSSAAASTALPNGIIGHWVPGTTKAMFIGEKLDSTERASIWTAINNYLAAL